MIVNCPKCKEPIELSLTNVLRQRIEIAIDKWDNRPPTPEVSDKIVEVLKDLLK